MKLNKSLDEGSQYVSEIKCRKYEVLVPQRIISGTVLNTQVRFYFAVFLKEVVFQTSILLLLLLVISLSKINL